MCIIKLIHNVQDAAHIKKAPAIYFYVIQQAIYSKLWLINVKIRDNTRS